MTTRTSPPPPGDRTGRGLETLTTWVLAHKRTVAGLWIVLTIAGFWGSMRVVDRVDDQFTMPDSEATVANEQIVERFGNGGGTTPLLAVAELPTGTTVDSPGVRGDLRRLERALGEAVPGSRIASYGSTGERAYASDDGATTFAVLHPEAADDGGPGGAEIEPGVLNAARETIADADVGGADVMLTGDAVLADEPEESGGGSEFLSETLIAGVAALAVLVFVFASALALVPLMMALVAIPTTLLAVLGLTQLTTVSFIVVFLVSLIGLGIAIDYALIVVMRWREERERGLSNEDAVRTAAVTAGRAVLFSGSTVAIGLLAAVVLPIPFLRSMGVGGLLIPLVSVAVALTLLPVVLATLGPRADRRRLRRADRAERHWGRWAAFIVRHRVAAATTGTAVLLALCLVAAGMTLGEPEANALGGKGEPKRALTALEDSGIGAGPIAPLEVLTPAPEAEAAAAELAEVDGVRATSAPGEGWRAGDQAVVEVFTAADTNSGAGRDTTEAVRAAAGGLPSAQVGGETPQVIDWVDKVYGLFPVMLALISLITFVLLARAFHSIVLPLKAILMNLLSVFATWGVMTLVWQHGFGTELLFNSDPTGAVAFWAPVIVFAFIYGISMDYEVFILARMREEYDRTGSTDEAVVRGIASTGRLVTSAALILFLAFGALGLEGDLDFQMLATGLAGGVLLDAVVVRSLLVPATVSWLGKWNWWMPDRARRILRLPHRAEPALERA